MLQTFPDYKKSVIAHFQNKKEHKLLSLNMRKPTPSNLKDECEAVYNERYSKDDEKALRQFFGPIDANTTRLKSIQKCETSKLKPLSNLLKVPAKGTHDRNIELLAWLIDFKPRPHEVGRVIDSDKSPDESNNKESEGGGADETPIRQEPTLVRIPKAEPDPREVNPVYRPARKTRAAILVGILAISLGTGAYWKWNNWNSYQLSIGSQACMYWAGDHYQQVSCNAKFKDTLIIALDSQQLIHFRKIMPYDTITYRAIGHVWYIKLNNNLEYFTANGCYPLDRNIRLKPITIYIIDKYILHRTP